MVAVVFDAEPRSDQVTDHGARPHTARESGRLRPRLDHRHQLGLLRVVEPRGGTWNWARSQSIHARNVVPLEPPIDRPPRDVQLLAERDDLLALDVAQDGFGSTPRREIPASFTLGQELRQRPNSLGSPASKSNRFSL